MSAPIHTGLVVEQSPSVALEVQAAHALTAGGSGAQNVGELLRFAIERNVPVESLEKLFGLYERMSARDAAKEFNEALAAFQRECPSIKKARTAKIPTKSGSEYSFTFADLPEIKNTVDPFLVKYGFSYSWDSESDGKGSIRVTCTLSHINGHSKTSSIALPIENPSAMSPQQKVGAALTYGERRTLANVLGITIEETPPEAVKDADPTTIDEDAAIEIEDLLKESGVDRAKFLKYMAVSKVSEIRAADYAKAKTGIKNAAARKKASPQ